MTIRSTDSPGVIAWPPALFIGALALGLATHWLWPVRPFPVLPARIVGALLFAASGLLGTWGATTMRRAGTNIRPDQPTTTIVTNGPFRFSRNPLYLACTGLYLGIALLVDAL